jgi:sialidase-1
MKRLNTGLCSLLVLAVSSDLAFAVETVTVFQNGNEGYSIFRIPAIIRAANGDLLAFCEAREGGDASAIDLVLKRSTDEGRTWGKLQLVQDNKDYRELFGEQPPPITIGNPAPVVDHMAPEHLGRIWLPFTLENNRVFVLSSDDHGMTWSARREITSTVKRKEWGWYATGPGHSIQISRGRCAGRLVVPADHRLGGGGEDRGPEGAHVIYSDDHGKTWSLGAVDDTYQDDLKANETTVVELNDGRLYFNTRDQLGAAPGTRAGAYSTDGGLTFEPTGDEQYRWFKPESDVLDPPVVECSLLRATSRLDGDARDVILFAGPDENGPSRKGRSDLRIRYSTDETATWHDGLLVHEGPAAYSDMVRLGAPSARIGILYEAGNRTGKTYDRIEFAVFSMSDLTGLPDEN